MRIADLQPGWAGSGGHGRQIALRPTRERDVDRQI
jgi:hypothetical protein